MIAMMIKFYDEKNKCVIGGYSLDGDDFMLKKGYENEEFNEENIIKNIVFSSAIEKLLKLNLRNILID